ncbi:hypothetical protein RM533_09235 [Croceicoccus sp. F390]|uniref:Phosphohydrolase-associated domain-containing protein n=1 Tax=Croceicoccus esteveae TaxID=3075597 RepID=A0ABU2ZIE6_9SPHN|nr:hypothetical protein [Croceicoccus sp. F390]MDT0576369.1 hypothetical protein [Croceicoccus sp. F390]
MVHHFITNVEIETRNAFDEPLLRYEVTLSARPRKFVEALKNAVAKCVILSPAVQHLEFKGKNMVLAVFEALSSDPAALLPRPTYDRYREAPEPTRVICDHIAGMTDAFLLRTYDRLFSPRMGSIFDRI